MTRTQQPQQLPVKRRFRPLSASVAVLLVAASLALFVTSRRVMDDQEQRLLAERADAVKALLTNFVGGVDSSLRVLGPVGASADPASAALFSASAGQLLGTGAKAVVVAANGDAGFTVVRAVGEGPAVGAPLSTARAALTKRALAQHQLVSALITEQGQRRLLLARPVGDTPAVIYQESLVDPRPVPAAPGSPFRELRGNIYAAPRVDPARLLYTTEANGRVPGTLARATAPVGADQWLLVVAARTSMVGSFGQQVPWVLLAGGLLMALLATSIIEMLARRRAYALALVAERTGALEHALEQLGETRAFLERLLTAGPVMVKRIRSSDLEVTYVSPNVERVLGVTQEQALAPGFHRSQVHPDDRLGFDDAVSRAGQGSVREELDYRVIRGDGSVRWVSAVFVPEVDDDGYVVAVLGYIVDVEDRRRAEDALRDAQETADAANRSKSEFLSRMSHELRTPLNAVLGFGQLLEIDELTDEQRDAVTHILKGGRHLLDLINEVLDISRIEAGELAMSPEAVSASELVQDAVDLIRPLADQRGIQLAVESTGADCYVFADRQRVKQVLLNLLSNAVKYNRTLGSVAVSCEQHEPTRLRINVADTGVGIPSERLGMLFVPFERLGAEHTAEEGTGIGLALSKKLAEAMGGTLEAASTLGKGSTFTVELPMVEGPVERYERLRGGDVMPPEPAAPRRVVLHIEDNLSNLSLVERVLAQRSGVEVVAAMHGRLGLELARQHHPMLVLLDLHLPDIGGDEVLQRLRDDPATASIPVAIVSADATPGQVQRLLSAGAAAYLTKPIDVRQLLQLIDESVVVT